jgi:hypothetical protein
MYIFLIQEPPILDILLHFKQVFRQQINFINSLVKMIYKNISLKVLADILIIVFYCSLFMLNIN